MFIQGQVSNIYQRGKTLYSVGDVSQNRTMLCVVFVLGPLSCLWSSAPLLPMKWAPLLTMCVITNVTMYSCSHSVFIAI